jgi:hypothetical protein
MEQLELWPKGCDWRKRLGRASLEKIEAYWLRSIRPLPQPRWLLGRICNCYGEKRIMAAIDRVAEYGAAALRSGERPTIAALVEYLERTLRQETAERKLERAKNQGASLVLVPKKPGSVHPARIITSSKLRVMPHTGQIQ